MGDSRITNTPVGLGATYRYYSEDDSATSEVLLSQRGAVSGAVGAGRAREGQATVLATQTDAVWKESYQRYYEMVTQGSQQQALTVPDIIRRATDLKEKLWGASAVTPADTSKSTLDYTRGILESLADSAGPKTQPSESLLKSKVAAGDTGSGVYARVVQADYLNDPTKAVLSPSQKVWYTPVEDIAGAKLDKQVILGQLGFSDDAISTSWDKDYMLLLQRDDEITGKMVPTFEGALKAITLQNYKLKNIADNHGISAEDLLALDYPRIRSEMKQRSLSVRDSVSWNQYFQSVPGYILKEQAALKIRGVLDYEIGMNEYFRGDGLTSGSDGVAAAREVGGTPILFKDTEASFEVISLRNSDGIATKVVDESVVVRSPGARGNEFVKGAKSNALIDAALTGLQKTVGVLSGRLEVGQALSDGVRELPVTLGQGALFGSLEVAVEKGAQSVIDSAAEKVTTSFSPSVVSRFIPAFVSKGSALGGQALRQVGGSSVAVAGAAVGGLISSIEQGTKWKAGEVSTSKAVGTVAAEVAVGGSSAAAGMIAGALAGSAVPVAGTAVGALAGLGAGLLVDWGARGSGIHQALEVGTTAAVQTTSDTMSDFAKNTTSYMEAAKKYLPW